MGLRSVIVELQHEVEHLEEKLRSAKPKRCSKCDKFDFKENLIKERKAVLIYRCESRSSDYWIGCTCDESHFQNCTLDRKSLDFSVKSAIDVSYHHKSCRKPKAKNKEMK